MRQKSTYIKGLILVLLTIFFFVGFLGFGHTEMPMVMEGQMNTTCPFMPGMSSLCHMDPLEHLTAWQNIFAAIPSQLGLFVALLLLIISVIVVRRIQIPDIPTPFLHSISSQVLYSKTYIPIVSPLQEAFSNGILHSKIF